MENRKVVSRDEWLVARQAHLRREREFTRLRGRLAEEGRLLPWEAATKA